MLPFSATVGPTLIEDDLVMAGLLRAQRNVASGTPSPVFANVNWPASPKQKDRAKAVACNRPASPSGDASVKVGFDRELCRRRQLTVHLDKLDRLNN
jgi:hypothetical protein